MLFDEDIIDTILFMPPNSTSSSYAQNSDYIVALKLKTKGSFSRLYDDYSKALYGYILTTVQDRPVADDLLQEVFIKIWRSIDTYDPDKGALFTWMMTITKRICIDYFLSKSHKTTSRTNTLDNIPVPGPVFYRPEEFPAFEVKIKLYLLKKHLREVLYLSFYLGFTHKQIAVMLDEPIGTIKTRIRRAIKQLKVLYTTQ